MLSDCSEHFEKFVVWDLVATEQLAGYGKSFEAIT